MIDKMNGQLALGHRLRGVNVRQVASSVVRSHFLPDLRGNLNAYGRQKGSLPQMRSLLPTHAPLRQLHSAEKRDRSRPFEHGCGEGGGGLCNGNLALTVSEGAVRKYIEVMRFVMDHYGVDLYTRQNAEWLASSADSLFNNDRAKQLSLSDFL